MSLYKDVMGAKVENWKQLHNLILSHRQILTHDICRQKVSEPEDLPEHGVTVVFVELPNTKGREKMYRTVTLEITFTIFPPICSDVK